MTTLPPAKPQPTPDCQACLRCKGTSICISPGFEVDGKVYPERRYRCPYCNRIGWFAPPNAVAIKAAIAGRKANSLRTTRPKDEVAYYVWRMARFRAGADVTMPMTAQMLAHAYPFITELDILADVVAKQVYGTHLAAAARLGKALGMI